MPLTPNYNIFYPGSSDPWDMSANLNTMANSIDTALADVGGVKAATTIAGLGTGDFDGQFGWLSGIDAGLRWAGTVWQAIQAQKVADSAARDILFPAPVAGDTVFRVDLGYGEFYTGTMWTRVPVATSQLPSGTVLQTVSTSTSTQVTSSTATYVSTGLAVTITPLFADSKIFVLAEFPVANFSSSVAAYFTVFRGTVSGTNLGTGSPAGLGQVYSAYGQVRQIVPLHVVDSPATTSATTYTVAFNGGASGSNTSVMYENRLGTLTVMEIRQ